MMGERPCQIVFIRHEKIDSSPVLTAGLADKFGWDLALAHYLGYHSHGFNAVWNLSIFGFSLSPSLQRRYLSRIKLKDGRKRKNAEPVEDEWNW